MSKWRAVTLGDVVELQRGYDLTDQARRAGGVPVIGSAGPNGWHDTPKMPGPGVTVGRSGASAGVATYVNQPYWPHNTVLFVKDFKGNDARFVYYMLKKMPLATMNSGSAQQSLNRNFLYPLAVCIPEPIIQRRIGSILGAYDDLIEINRRRIAILEEMARRLYDERFLHVLPSMRSAAETGGSREPLPQGWRWVTLGDLCRETRDTVLPAQIASPTPYVGLEHIPRRSITLDKYGSPEHVSSLKLRFRRGDILFGKIRPYFHKVALAPFDGVASSDAIVIRPLSDHLRGLVLMVTSSDAFVAHSVQTSNGTKMPRANWGVLTCYPVPMPPRPLLEAFDRFVMDAANAAATYQASNERLSFARDLLLPRLISGDLPVMIAEQELEAAD